MLKHSLLLGTVLCLSSCSYALDRQVQDVTIVTPGAEDTICYMYVDGLRYKIYAPQTVNISKSHNDLTVDCVAPQNRRRKVVIEPHLSDHQMMNIANAGLGTAWDVASNSAFTYPEVITVDFTSAVPMPEAPPAQNNPDIRQPEEYDLEEFTSNLPRLNSDRNATTIPLQRREGAPPAAPAYTEGGITNYQGPGKPADKGDLKGVTDGLTTSTVPKTDQPVSKPVSAVMTAPSGTAPAAPAPTVAPVAPPAPVTPPGVQIEAYPIKSMPPPASTAPASNETAGPLMTDPDPSAKSGPPIPLIPQN